MFLDKHLGLTAPSFGENGQLRGTGGGTGGTVYSSVYLSLGGTSGSGSNGTSYSGGSGGGYCEAYHDNRSITYENSDTSKGLDGYSGITWSTTSYERRKANMRGGGTFIRIW